MPPSSVILMRHAHAEEPAEKVADFDRPLTRQGMQAAAAAAQAICMAGHWPALILASPALRTRQTAEALATALDISTSAILCIDSMYNASADVLGKILHQHGGDATQVALIAHNPGISELAQRLSANPSFRGFPPAGWLNVEVRTG
jgi:phosphohistidine phosphatase